MPIEVEDIAEPAPVATDESQGPGGVAERPAQEPLEAEAPAQVGAVEQPTPAPKKRGRPPGSKNKPKADPEEPAPVLEAPKAKPKPAAKKVKVAPPPPPSESEEDESEEDPEPPPSPATQRRAQWAHYRQRQVDAHQSRVAGYTRALEKCCTFENHADARSECTIRRAPRRA